MLILSVILSLVLVIIINWAYVQKEGPVWWASMAMVGATASICVCFLPPFWLHSFFILLGTQLWRSRQWSASSLLLYMILAMLPAYGFWITQMIQQVTRENELRERYAFESIETRLPVAKKSGPAKLSVESKSNLATFETNLEQDYSGQQRARMLDRLHQGNVQSFIDSPGFGVTRGSGRGLRGSTFNIEDRGDEPIPQPGTPFLSTVTDDDIAREPDKFDPAPLRQMHLDGVLDFVNPKGFGLFVSRQKVAGFISHQFSKVPTTSLVKIQAIELIGLLKHDEPVAYMSNELPRMDKLSKVPTRALNSFEVVGLKKLQVGDDLFIRETTEGIRMLGAVRAIDKCIECHGGERGDLLGAFSYSLTRISEK